ncbi:MAG TPA: HEAT repeat domain-containing protein [Verrucomicrobiae bacterium]|nr:HEAT repeat domain-containing protein [Verrucomicrobiae bacterium]
MKPGRTLSAFAWLGAVCVSTAAPTPPAGWRLDRVASFPTVRHPSVVACAPDGRVFVAEDPMDIITRADEKLGRIVCLHPDGRATTFATNLHAVFGMQYLEGKLYVLHNPKFSVFTDDAGVGRDRDDLIQSTLPNPWALDWNDHVPANFRLGMDGYFYVAVGDKGLYQCTGRDGSQVNLHGGGVLRLRPDGTELEIFSTGTRNILDVALTAEDELFTYDNTDEHQWMGRLTHMVDGGFYGYPHDFIPRRPYTLWMMHDFGAGAACGALAYNEDALPAEFHGNLFLADFGKRQVTRVRIERDGATFRVAAHEELFRDVPEDFRPVGLAWSADGVGLYICDWQHRDVKEKNAEVGRLWKLTWTGTNHATPKPAWVLKSAVGKPTDASTDELITALAHPSREVRLTAQRALARGRRGDAADKLVAALKGSNVEPGRASTIQRSNPSTLQRFNDSTIQRFNDSTNFFARCHAFWALDALDRNRRGDKPEIAPRESLRLLASPAADVALVRQAIRQLGNRRGRAAVPALLPALKHDIEVSIRFQAATALGRIADTNAIPALLDALDEPDLFARFAVFTALNRIGRAHDFAWPAIAAGLESPNARIREGTAFALRETYSEALVTALLPLAGTASRGPATREAALNALAALHHQPPAWRGEWWAYHPAKAPPPERNVSWAGTVPILETLRAALAESSPPLRLAAVEGVGAARDTNAAPRLRELFLRESELAIRQGILAALTRLRDTDSAPLFASAVQDRATDAALRKAAASALGELRDTNSVPALAAVLGAPASEPARSPEPAGLRLAAIESLGRIGGDAAVEVLRTALKAVSLDDRRAAIRALGSLRDKSAVPDLILAWQSADTRAEALAALARFSDLRALDAYLEGLASADPTVREQCRKALGPIRTEALPQIERRATAFSSQAVAELRQVYSGDQTALQRPLFLEASPVPDTADYERHALAQSGDAARGQRVYFDESGVACIRCHMVADTGGTVGPDLTLAGAQFSRAQLIESILYPSRAVREGYQQIIVETKEGEEISGALKADTADGVMLVDAGGRTNFIPRASIADRRGSALSLMPEGLHAGITLDQFADLVAYVESRKIDSRLPAADPPPAGFVPLFNGRDLTGWREYPNQPKRVGEAGARSLQGAAPSLTERTTKRPEGRPPEHWLARDGVLEHDGKAADLWTEREFADFTLRFDWRWPDAPKWEHFPIIGPDSTEAKSPDGKPQTERVLDAGDSGVFLRGLRKAQANLFCYPVGSGEVWEYRTDLTLPEEVRRGATPKRCADAPVGDWNRMEITVRADRMTVVLNGQEVITEARLPGLPPRGPIGFQHEHGRIQLRNIFIAELPAPPHR